MTPQYFDVHSHISFSKFGEDRDEVVARMNEAGVMTITVGTDLENSAQAVACAERHDNVWATVGLHPTDTKNETFNPDDYEALAKHPKVVAVGECGLDYYRIDKNDAEEKKRQKVKFEKQVVFSMERDLPLMVHGRPAKGSMDAYEDILDVLSEHSGVRGNIHFFVGNLDVAERFIKLGFTLSFTGVLTFARDYDEVVKKIPLTSILSETDSPYAAPDPYRGKRNEPMYVVEVVQKIAEIREEELKVVQRQLVKNAQRVFKI